MATFEEQLTNSAQRIKHEDDKKFRVPQNPMTGKRTYWGWVATPAAAVIGIVFGMSLPMLVNDAEQQVQFVQVHDTIHVPHHTQDTIYLTKVEERERIVWRDRKVKDVDKKVVDNKSDMATQNEPQCTSISCDGIDYAMFVSR
ncbi:MAG: hypothetical protein KBT29_01395 [Prevotellaceae bacterium]|nr:hypothetical protein [Candidatus Minthosoma caballi]